MLADTSFTASYDAGNRITNWNRGGAPVNNAQSWNYDDNGNWISTTKDETTEARNHDDTDQLTQIAGNAASNDAKGNLTEYEQNGKEYEVDYDLDNRIIKVDVDNNDVEYRYDALGRRVIRQEGTTKTALIWWGDSENAEHKHQAGQTVIQNDIMAHPSRLNSVIARAVDGSKFKLEWYHKNYLDHVYAVSDDDGDILEHYRYTAFGEVQIYNANGNQVATTQIDNHILWNTRRRDEVTGYYLYKFRHYSPELGRWPSRDPIEEAGGVNLYAFVGNDGINRWDRLGLESKTKCKRDCLRNPPSPVLPQFVGEYCENLCKDKPDNCHGYSCDQPGQFASAFGLKCQKDALGTVNTKVDQAVREIRAALKNRGCEYKGTKSCAGKPECVMIMLDLLQDDFPKETGGNDQFKGCYYPEHSARLDCDGKYRHIPGMKQEIKAIKDFTDTGYKSKVMEYWQCPCKCEDKKHDEK